MSQRSRFFDSTAGDRVYTSDAWAQVVAALMGNGVVAGIGNELVVHESSPAAMSVRVNTGVAFVLGYYFEVYTSQETLALTAAHATLPRIDRVVVRRSLAGRTASLVVIDGTPASSPVPTALTQIATGIYDIPLAQIRVDALATSVVDAKITDERGSRASSYDLLAALNATTGHAHTPATNDGGIVLWNSVGSKPSSFAPSAHDHSTGGGTNTVGYGSLSGVPSSFAPSDHAHTATPGDGGLVSYASVTGKPATFAPSAHAASHAAAGSDPVTVTYAQLTGKPSSFAPSDHAHTAPGDGGLVAYSSLSGKPSSFTAAAHALDPASGFHTGSLPWASVSSKPTTFAPSTHASSHANGGSDEVSIAWGQITTGVPASFAPSAHALDPASGFHTGSLPWTSLSGKPNLGIISDSTAGDTGVTVYVQTATPSAPVDGDVWIKG